jgi:hypothetical protein
VAAVRRARRGPGKPETFTFLGFTFIGGKSRRGKFLLVRKTRRDRLRAKLREIKEELRRRMHRPVPEQGRWLRQVVTGFFNHHAVPTNGRALVVLRHHGATLWHRTLRRRSQRDWTTWERTRRLAVRGSAAVAPAGSVHLMPALEPGRAGRSTSRKP